MSLEEQAAPAPMPAPLPTAEGYRHQRAMRALYERTRPGPVYYILATLLTAAAGGYFEPLRAIVWWPILVFAAVFHYRRTHRPPANTCTVQQARDWWRRHWTSLHVSCGVWGCVLFGAGVIEQASTIPVVVACIATVALGTAVCEVASVERHHPTLAVILLQAPALAWFALQYPALRILSLTMAIYCTYLLGVQLKRRVAEFDNQMALEYELLSHRAELERMARLDALTGLANRREYQAVLEWAWAHARRNATPLSLMVIDLDHFKSVNDRYGHAGGDACLHHVAEVLRGQFRRSTDLVARIGGEEFVVLMPGVPLGEALRLAEHCRALIERAPTTRGQHVIVLTASIGVGSADSSGDGSPEAFFSRVDAACYQAKHGGRNQVMATPSGRAEVAAQEAAALPAPPAVPLAASSRSAAPQT